jgi:chaperone required for assembly of F1-ATPase
MRDLIEDLFGKQAVDPGEAIRRDARPRLVRRFYERAEVAAGDRGFSVLLDGRPVQTPARRALAAPDRALADALAAEWAGQTDVIDPAAMPLTRLANSIIDGVADAQDRVAAEAQKYLETDLVFYRADTPEKLVARQAVAWDPILAFARDELGARFVLAQGLVFVQQPEGALAAARAAIPREPWPLGAFHAVTTLTGSALIALAVLHGRLLAEQAWAAAHVDEDWNMEQWGADDPALARRALRFAEMQAACLVLRGA